MPWVLAVGALRHTEDSYRPGISRLAFVLIGGSLKGRKSLWRSLEARRREVSDPLSGEVAGRDRACHCSLARCAPWLGAGTPASLIALRTSLRARQAWACTALAARRPCLCRSDPPCSLPALLCGPFAWPWCPKWYIASTASSTTKKPSPAISLTGHAERRGHGVCVVAGLLWPPLGPASGRGAQGTASPEAVCTRPALPRI